ncbi:MAG: glycoside hydrolase family 88 protein, partial [Acidobacteriota bacterium]|nr:glycoside hydrolase family 88 protein [Acidobacteriota bacterium]
RELYVRVFREMAETVAAIQPADGLWRSNLLESRTSIPGETSGTALFCYALTWGMRTGVLERDHYRPVVERAWAGLYGLVNDDGRLGWVQKPGASPHATKERNWAVYGTGAFLLAGSELLMLGGK